MKKCFIPLMVARSHELPFFVAAYALTGRFNPDHEVKVHQSEEEAATSNVDWKTYRSQFRERREDDASLERDWDLLLRTRERMNSMGN
jgi:hypothetical protein